ncbi:hypothetical protein M529_03085 [Sphingobium ummariense RL-3]|uniref:Uncharacterized protein n=2 Tax=Alphaproteobacteria TaxID=28211 RepID=T0J6R9_9SPHN|nr:hypothetical protein M529_03085 [Sphingobium ummariense RL-3]KMO22433.1 hypothetical protein QR78_07055 [Methylobacterium indicum]KMO26540.1 hypothetical protein QR79_01900 [Methylobacterium indicum]
MLLFSIRVPSCGKAPISVRLVEQATRIDVQRTRECVRHLCNASRIETKVVSVSRIVEHIGGAKAHFTDQTDGIYHQPAATGEHDVFMMQIAM